MPAYLSKEKILGLKVVSVFPDNIQHNKPSINGTILLLDATSGELVFKSVGLAIQDLGVAQVVYQNALKMNLGSTFKLN